MTAVLFAAFAVFVLIELLMALIWLVAYQIQKTSIVDIFWSLLVFFASVIYFKILSTANPSSYFYLSLVCFWSMRLALHIYFRGRAQGEDARYQALRTLWGKHEQKKMLIFFMQQGVAAWIFSIPFLILFASRRGEHFGLWEIAGVFIWLLAFNGEAISDAQLTTFKNNSQNHGKVCRVGFWKYSRHPNYFFEWLNWVAFACLAWPHAGGWVALVCPALMYYFLNHVSGVPLAEKQALKSRSAEYLEYQRNTSSFFLWFPKRVGCDA